MLKIQSLAVIISLIICTITYSQTTVNPDISVIGDMRVSIHDQKGTDDYSKLDLALHEIEIAANGYLNPFTRADVFLAIHGPEASIEIEEAYMTIVRGLPLGLQMKAGQYLLDFGKINTQHPHQWSWIERPLVYQVMFGNDGLRDVSLNFSGQYPLGKSALNLSANLMRGHIGGHHHNDEGNEVVEEEEARPDLGICMRSSIFTMLSKFTAFDFGISTLRGEVDPNENHYATMTAIDFKLKWRPDSYRSLTFIGEALQNRRTVDDEDSPSGSKDITSYGGFFAMDYQFRKRWDSGVFVDYTQGVNDSDENQTGYGIFAGFALVEETTRFGLLLRRDDNLENVQWNTALVQILWSLGPHKPHKF